MYDNPDHAAMLRAMDAALVEQARLWRSFVSAYDDMTEAHDVDWTEEFCLVVRNRLAKLQRQQVLANICQARHRDVRHTAGQMVSRRNRDVQST